MSGIVKIHGKVQNYQWGGVDYISRLIDQPNTDGSPWAEYWLGTHPAAPAVVGEQTLSDYLLQQRLPSLQFLFKVLDVKEMLSIQVHPTPEQAQAGFARENAEGIALDAVHRNYKDNSDKPELAVALSEFWLLHGFRALDEIQTQLQQIPYLQPLLDSLQQKGLAAAFEFALDSDHESIVRMHEALYNDIINGHWQKSQIQFWMHRWLSDNPQSRDGLLTLFFLNVVKLAQGEAIYQPAGMLHAYLEGQTIELMANSDNVLRAGLTPKHIDVPELLSTCHFKSTAPPDFIIDPRRQDNGEIVFPTPFTAFELSMLQANTSADYVWCAQTLEILFCVDGRVSIDGQPVVKGDALLVSPGSHVTLSGDSFCLYRARNL